MIVDSTPSILKRTNDVQRKRHQAQSRKELQAALRYYMLWHVGKVTGGDVEKLVEQGMKVVEGVAAHYPSP